MYNNASTRQSITNQEFLKHLLQQTPTYETNPLRRKFFFAKAVTLLDKTLSCSRIDLSSSQSKVFDGADSKVFSFDFAQQLCPRNSDIPWSHISFRRCWYISDPDSEPKCLRQIEKKLDLLQDLNARSSKDCKQKVLLLLCLCTVFLQLATYKSWW